MGLVVAGAMPLVFVALVVGANLRCPAVFQRSGAQLFFGALVLFGAASIVLGWRARSGASGARITGQLPAGLAAGMLVQPSTSFLFALGIAFGAVAGGPTRVPHRLAGSALFALGAIVGYALAYSPLVLGGDVARC